MAENNDTQAGINVEEDKLAESWASHPDPVLNGLVRMAEVASFPVTLLVPGAEITGQLISGNVFSKRTIDKFSSGARSVDEDLHSRMTELFSTLVSVPTSEEIPEERKLYPLRFIHLEKVKIIGDGWTPSSNREFDVIRVPIAQVVGWTYGTSR